MNHNPELPHQLRSPAPPTWTPVQSADPEASGIANLSKKKLANLPKTLGKLTNPSCYHIGDGTLPSLVGSIFPPISHPFSPISLIFLKGVGMFLGGGSLKRYAKRRFAMNESTVQHTGSAKGHQGNEQPNERR